MSALLQGWSGGAGFDSSGKLVVSSIGAETSTCHGVSYSGQMVRIA